MPSTLKSSRQPSLRAADLTEVRAVRDRAADWVDRLIANNQVQIGSLWTERIVARRTNLDAGLPPAVLTTDDIRRKCVIHPHTRPHAPARCLNLYPVTRADAALRSRCRM